MYAVVERRRVNLGSLEETMQRAESEFYPALQRAPGFIRFDIVADIENGIITAITAWDTQAQAVAFEPENRRWGQALEELGNALQSDNRGDAVITVEAEP